ncbi:MAG: hypothetical protein AAB110_04380 [Candidatus Desantisbacteria bacterium]
MELNIQQLSEKRKKWVEANQENGFEDGIKQLLINLYPDNAHFIYELLQNAEDVGASEVRFILQNDRVEFEHNGDRLFSIEDVNSITSIGKSSKKDDPTSIGKFGVGFKAVFAYTSTPKIESGEFHFCIRDLVVPDTNGLAPCSLGEKQTHMIFPFDNPKKSAKKAFTEIEKNLRQLNESTLLFLSNIKKIKYFLPDAIVGSLERIESDGNQIKISVKHPENSKPVTAVFLRFEKKVDVKDEDGKQKSCRIAIAFSMEENDAQWSIKPLEPGQVSIYFPADKETSNLRFHLHAPFASTVARDSVRDCSSNNELRDHLANLIAESMAAIRDQGLLTVKFLATLPNNKDTLPSFYKPIMDRLIKEFKDKKLTPMKQGGHAAAQKIYTGSAQMSNLISDNELATILDKDCSLPLWVANPTQKNQREDNFLSMFNISKFTTEELINKLCACSLDLVVKWFAQKEDEWHQQLYALFHTEQDPMSIEKLRRLCIIRISDDTYNIGKECYFPSDGVEHDNLMPRVAKGVYTSGKNEEQKKEAKEFLEAVGVRKVDDLEVVKAILKQRYLLKNRFTTIDDKTYPDDLKLFIDFVEKSSLSLEARVNLFADYSIFKLSHGKFAKPSEAYLDLPFCDDTGLTVYYREKGSDKKFRYLRYSLSDNYYKACGIDLKKIGMFAENVGVQITEPCISSVVQTKTIESQVKKEASAKSLGFKSIKDAEEAIEMMDLRQKDPDGYRKWKESNKEKPSFPTNLVINSERRQEHLVEQLANAPEKEYEQRGRSVRTTGGSIDPEVGLRNKYTNKEGQMVCQICKKEMPFKKRDGKYYFEAVEALSRDYFSKEHEAQYLALCPLCAAMYNEFVKCDDNAMEKLYSDLKNSKGFDVPLKLGELETSIRFVDSHRQDIKTILELQE